jgi:hypothetical protein
MAMNARWPHAQRAFSGAQMRLPADQLHAVEVEVVSVGPNRAAGLDPRALEENCIPLE